MFVEAQMFGFQTPVIVIAGPAIVYLVLILLTLRRRGLGSWLHGIFFLYLLIGIMWAIGKSLSIAQGLMPLVPAYGALIATDTLAILPVLLAVLTILFLERSGAQWTGVIGVLWIAFIMLVDSNTAGLNLAFQNSLRLSTPAEATNAVVLVGWGGFTGGAAVLTAWDYIRIQRPLHRNRILYWLMAIILIGVGEGLAMSPLEMVTQIGAFTRLLGILLMTYAMLSYYLPSVRTVARHTIAAVVSTLVTAALFLGSFWLLRSLTSPMSDNMALGSAAVMAVLLTILMTPLRRSTINLVDRLLMGGGYDPARALRDYSAAITNILDLDTLVTMAVGVISESLEVRRGALLLTTEREDGRTEMRVVPGMGEVDTSLADFDPNSPILIHLQAGQQLLQYEIDLLPQFRASPARERIWLNQLKMELYVPIRRQSMLVGILALGSKAGEAPYTPKDHDVLSTLADQTAVALQNARLVSDLKALNADITDLNDELKRTNRRLEKLDAAKTNFIQIASHELRTPLTQVRGYADIMADAVQSGSPTPAQMAQISQGISRASVRLEEIISAMLDASQIDIEALSLRLTMLSVTTVVRMAVDNYNSAIQQRHQTLTIGDLEGLPPIEGDLQRLCQALSNIIGNCVKYTPDGGSIAIAGRSLRETSSGGMEKEFVEITIADTGIGIDPDELELVFEKFYRVGSPDLHSTGTTKFKGAGPGLGLPIARGVIRAHGGRVWVESPGHNETTCPGSTFHIVLPVSMPEAAVNVIASAMAPAG
jgi:signal transduction histidine kinase